ACVQIYPVKVQGEGAAKEIVAGLKYFNVALSVDVLILARGGGSLEDLWSFNEEIVARAIVESLIPIITGVGHETDFTIADFVADLRAPTPSAAAEMVIATRAGLLERLNGGESKLRQAARLTQRADELDYQLRDAARAALQRRKRALDSAASRLGRLDVRLRFAEARRR